MWRYAILVVLLIAAGCSGGGSDTPSPTGGVGLRFAMAGAGMEPTFLNGDLLNVQRYDAPVGRGDVIVFVAPTSTTREFVKRVIAGPGDVVRIDEQNSLLFVNGGEVAEPYVQGLTQCGTRATDQGSYFFSSSFL